MNSVSPSKAIAPGGNGNVSVISASPSSPIRKRRLRARKACEPCRDRKRKCDGNHPCSNCTRLQYECHFVSVRRNTDQGDDFHHVPAPATTERTHRSGIDEVNGRGVQDSDKQLSSMEANSGAVFVRKLALALDPANAPRLQLFAWNLFLGGRIGSRTPCVRPVVEIVSRASMESLASIYLAKVDPCYGFIDHDVLQQHMSTRWLPNALGNDYDAVLCGIAALGFLFSRIKAEDAEVDLVATAQHMLEQSSETRPSINIVTGWVLRSAYLRMSASAHTAWMASCAMMHNIEASGIHVQPSQTTSLLPAHNQAPELCRRIFSVARHLNIWISFDLGRTRVILPQAQPGLPTARAGDYTTELMSLLSASELLAPEKEPSTADLRDALFKVVRHAHTEPPSVLAQTNLCLILMRRLRALDSFISGSLLDEVLSKMSDGLRAAETMLNSRNPWHHVPNVPFQIVCILLAIDTPSTIALLGDAIKTLNNVAQIYDTEAAREALSTACLLIHLHQKRKSMDATSLSEVLRTYSSLPSADVQDSGGPYPNWMELEGLNNASWLDDLMTDLPNLQGFDVNQLLLDENTYQSVPPQW